jgi:hypothetical protein
MKLFTHREERIKSAIEARNLKELQALGINNQDLQSPELRDKYFTLLKDAKILPVARVLKTPLQQKVDIVKLEDKLQSLIKNEGLEDIEAITRLTAEIIDLVNEGVSLPSDSSYKKRLEKISAAATRQEAELVIPDSQEPQEIIIVSQVTLNHDHDLKLLDRNLGLLIEKEKESQPDIYEINELISDIKSIIRKKIIIAFTDSNKYERFKALEEEVAKESKSLEPADSQTPIFPISYTEAITFDKNKPVFINSSYQTHIPNQEEQKHQLVKSVFYMAIKDMTITKEVIQKEKIFSINLILTQFFEEFEQQYITARILFNIKKPEATDSFEENEVSTLDNFTYESFLESKQNEENKGLVTLLKLITKQVGDNISDTAENIYFPIKDIILKQISTISIDDLKLSSLTDARDKPDSEFEEDHSDLDDSDIENDESEVENDKYDAYKKEAKIYKGSSSTLPAAKQTNSHSRQISSKSAKLAKFGNLQSATFIDDSKSKEPAAYERNNDFIKDIPYFKPIISGKSKESKKKLKRNLDQAIITLDELKKSITELSGLKSKDPKTLSKKKELLEKINQKAEFIYEHDEKSNKELYKFLDIKPYKNAPLNFQYKKKGEEVPPNSTSITESKFTKSIEKLNTSFEAEIEKAARRKRSELEKLKNTYQAEETSLILLAKTIIESPDSYLQTLKEGKIDIKKSENNIIITYFDSREQIIIDSKNYLFKINQQGRKQPVDFIELANLNKNLIKVLSANSNVSLTEKFEGLNQAKEITNILTSIKDALKKVGKNKKKEAPKEESLTIGTNNEQNTGRA